MSSVNDTIECGVCGGVKHTDFNCKSFEEYEICQTCGYSYTKKAILTEDRHYVLDKDGKRTYEITENKNPCGVYYFAHKSGVGQLGSLKSDAKEEDILKSFGLTDTSSLDMDESYINYRNSKTGEFKLIFGNNKPLSYEEWSKVIQKEYEDSGETVG